MGRPDGWETLPDEIYVVTLLTQPGTITVTSGGQAVEKQVPVGAHIFTVPAGVGKQHFSLSRNEQVVLQATSLMDISNVCPCGLYNFNPYVGTVPAGFDDPLGRDGLASLTIGLHVSTCSPTPSLGTNPPLPSGSVTKTTISTTRGQTSTITNPTSTPTTTSQPASSTSTAVPGRKFHVQSSPLLLLLRGEDVSNFSNCYD